MGIALDPASALDCAQLLEATGGGSIRKIGENRKGLLCAQGMHGVRILSEFNVSEMREKPVSTQCLTSAAHCLCSQSNSLALLSPIPIPASAACHSYLVKDAQPDLQATY